VRQECPDQGRLGIRCGVKGCVIEIIFYRYLYLKAEIHVCHLHLLPEKLFKKPVIFGKKYKDLLKGI